MPFESVGQKFYLGNYISPTPNEFELLGISSKTGVSTYKYKKPIYDSYFDRKIGDIIIGIKNERIVSTIYNVIPRANDIGVPQEILDLVQKTLPYPMAEKDGTWGVNIDNETVSIARLSNTLTFHKDRIMFINSIKQSILESNR